MASCPSAQQQPAKLCQTRWHGLPPCITQSNIGPLEWWIRILHFSRQWGFNSFHNLLDGRPDSYMPAEGNLKICLSYLLCRWFSWLFFVQAYFSGHCFALQFALLCPYPGLRVSQRDPVMGRMRLCSLSSVVSYWLWRPNTPTERAQGPRVLLLCMPSC